MIRGLERSASPQRDRERAGRLFSRHQICMRGLERRSPLASCSRRPQRKVGVRAPQAGPPRGPRVPPHTPPAAAHAGQSAGLRLPAQAPPNPPVRRAYRGAFSAVRLVGRAGRLVGRASRTTVPGTARGPGRRAFSAVRLVGRAGRRVGWSRPSGVKSASPRRPCRRAVWRPAGSAGQRPGPASAGPPALEQGREG